MHLILNTNFNNAFKNTLFGMPGGSFFMCSLPLTLEPGYATCKKKWASECNQDLLDIIDYSHEQCIRSNNKKGRGTSIYIHNSIQYRRRGDLALPPKKLYESVFIEVDKTIFNLNRNIIKGEIYNPPSSKL